MTINEASEFFKKLVNETDKKRKIKVYKNFIGILSNLRSRNLSKDELLMIQNEIELLNLKSKHGNTKLTAFKTYLNKEFSLITEGHYTTLGISLGMCFGAAIGVAFGGSGISIGIAVGMLIGLAIGKTKDMEAEKENRVMRTKLTGL
ncbi:MAG: hypothetical protein GQ574_11040 [Crocinitomix sp.]|nr:hypothetical protein [Crocinitomix sp.]